MKLNGKEINELCATIPVSYYRDNESYYVGRNRAIIEKKSKRNPDNRVPIAFANRLVKNLTGYAARKGDIMTRWEKEVEGADESFLKAYNEIEESSMLDLLNSRLYKTVLKQGAAYDVVWTEGQDSDFKIRVSDIPITQCKPIWEDDLSVVKKLSAFIRKYTLLHGKEENGITFEAGHYAQVFYPGRYEIWFLAKLDERGRTKGNGARLIMEQEQPFDMVQVSSYFGNDEQIPYWWPVKDLIDQFDKVMSGNMNEVDRFNDTWLMFMHKIDPLSKKKIDEMGIIDNLKSAIDETVNDVWPRFLERDIPVEHTRMMFDKLENLIYTIIGVPSFLDESFGAASGISLLFRLIGLEYAAVETDTYFDIGLENRNELIKQALSKFPIYNGNKVSQASIDAYNGEIDHKRNIPMDTAAIITDAVNLRMAGVSLEAVLRYLPDQIIPDVEAELERVKADAPSLPPLSMEENAV